MKNIYYFLNSHRYRIPHPHPAEAPYTSSPPNPLLDSHPTPDPDTLKKQVSKKHPKNHAHKMYIPLPPTKLNATGNQTKACKTAKITKLNQIRK